MSNAWSSYLDLLIIALIFMAAGGTLICTEFERIIGDKPSRKFGSRGGYAGIAFVLIGGALALAILLGSPTPWARQRIFDRIFRTPPDQIQRFVIKAGEPDQYQPLTHMDVVIEDRDSIRRVAAILRTARGISPNHPHAIWTAHVEMVTSDGTYYFTVEPTAPSHENGTLVNIPSSPTGGSWNLGDFRADGLEKIFEDAVGPARAN